MLSSGDSMGRGVNKRGVLKEQQAIPWAEEENVRDTDQE